MRAPAHFQPTQGRSRERPSGRTDWIIHGRSQPAEGPTDRGSAQPAGSGCSPQPHAGVSPSDPTWGQALQTETPASGPSPPHVRPLAGCPRPGAGVTDCREPGTLNNRDLFSLGSEAGVQKPRCSRVTLPPEGGSSVAQGRSSPPLPAPGGPTPPGSWPHHPSLCCLHAAAPARDPFSSREDTSPWMEGPPWSRIVSSPELHPKNAHKDPISKTPHPPLAEGPS